MPEQGGDLKISTTLAVALATIWITPLFAMETSMPAAEQTALVHRYCAVCHDDTHRNGGLSLQHFDAAHVDPSLAAMMVSKLHTGAIGASGLPQPDTDKQEALLKALTDKSSSAREWNLDRTPDAVTQARMAAVSIVREGASSRQELYRLKLTCHPDTRTGNIQLTWAPAAATGARVISAKPDDGAPIATTFEGRETMGNGAKTPDGKDSVSGSASVDLTIPLPSRALTISGIFPNDSVMFPFDQMTSELRQEVSACF
jgi:hypothetical protein